MKKQRLRILLIDDDPIFGHILHRTADNLNINLDVVQSVEQVGFIFGMKDYDIIIVDQNMQFMSGMEVAAYLASFFASKTVVLISSSSVIKDGGLGLPSFIDAFVHKDEGYYRVLKQALVTHKKLNAPPERDAVGNL
jgi:DNA-binding response OmpR family regulator